MSSFIALLSDVINPHSALRRNVAVWLKYCVTSRCLAMIGAEQSTEALPPHYVPHVAAHSLRSRDQVVVETLMIALVMIMGQILLDRIIQRAFPQHDHLRQGLPVQLQELRP